VERGAERRGERPVVSRLGLPVLPLRGRGIEAKELAVRWRCDARVQHLAELHRPSARQDRRDRDRVLRRGCWRREVIGPHDGGSINRADRGEVDPVIRVEPLELHGALRFVWAGARRPLDLRDVLGRSEVHPDVGSEVVRGRPQRRGVAVEQVRSRIGVAVERAPLRGRNGESRRPVVKRQLHEADHVVVVLVRQHVRHLPVAMRANIEVGGVAHGPGDPFARGVIPLQELAIDP